MAELTETQARAALTALRSPAPGETDTELALSRLVAELPVRAAHRPRALVPALGLGAIVVAAVLVLGLTAGLGGQRSGRLATSASPSPGTPGGSLATGLSTVASLVDVDGHLWASGSYPGGQQALVQVPIGSGRAGQFLLMDAGNGAVEELAHLATASGRVYATTSESGVETFAADGTGQRTFTAQQLGSDAETLAASPGTGLWLLSCCGAAPAAQQLVTRRDPASLAAIGNRREISAIPGSLLAAGPAGVWAVDGDSGEIRAISAVDSPENDPVIEAQTSQLPRDRFVVGADGPVLATAHELLTVNARMLEVRRVALPQGGSPTALTVVGTTAYLAFPGRVLRYDLSTLTQTGSYAVAGVTALSAGADGVWAATDGRLIRVDRLPVGPPEPGIGLRTVHTGLTGVTDLVDADGHLWLSSVTDDATNAGSIDHVDLGSGIVTRQGSEAPGQLATDGHTVVVDHQLTGSVHSWSSAGAGPPESPDIGALNVALSGRGLSVLSCCDTSTPTQHIRLLNPFTFAQRGATVSIQAEGEAGQLIAGNPGVWFLAANSSLLYTVDQKPAVEIHLANDGGSAGGSLTAMGDRGPVLVTPDLRLRTVIGTTVRSLALPDADSTPRALAVANATAYVAYPDRVLTYDLDTMTAGSEIPLAGVTALSAGADGVWAATGGTLVQLTR